ncbi:NAD(+)/NADH kinase [Ruminococcaceae bacterium OttesenSCG-928-O06]|nr:NAD(+)/NADH kinase [Ruminococcaceae bacterium OttesenSCG-928-O06]
MKVLLIPNLNKPSALEVLHKAGDILVQNGALLLMEAADIPHAKPAWNATACPAGEGFAACDMVLTIGGDGTMLHAARHTMRTGKPLLGINTGRLGFLTSIESNEVEKLHRLAKGEYLIQQRSVLCATTQARKDVYYALNDVVLCKYAPERAISLHIHCDDILVSRFRGDGVIFATPTGSTAYSMSAGGPIVDAALGGIVVTQICAHIVHTPPLVFAPARILQVQSCGTPEEAVFLSCDGAQNIVLEHGETVTIAQADKTVPLVQFNEAEQLMSIDTKLKGR